MHSETSRFERKHAIRIHRRLRREHCGLARTRDIPRHGTVDATCRLNIFALWR